MKRKAEASGHVPKYQRQVMASVDRIDLYSVGERVMMERAGDGCVWMMPDGKEKEIKNMHKIAGVMLHAWQDVVVSWSSITRQLHWTRIRDSQAFELGSV